MIVICSGCSFTHGVELWEEKNIPGYLSAKNHQEAHDISEEFFASTENDSTRNNLDAQFRDLTYSGYIKNSLGCEVINIGMGGASEQEIAQRTISTIAHLKKYRTTQQIVCIMQDTSPDRIWIKDTDPSRIFNRPIHGLKSYVLPLIEAYYFDKLEAYEIKNVYMKYINTMQMHFDYYMHSAMVQNYCTNNNVDFLHFVMWNNQHRELEFDIDMSYMQDMFFDDKYCMPVAMTYKLEDHFGDKSFYLPGRHVNCESHNLMGQWIIEEMKKRNIV